MDSSPVTALRQRLTHAEKVIFIDLGSGASLLWILMALTLRRHGHCTQLNVVNVDHSRGMHNVSDALEDALAGLLTRYACPYERRQVINPVGIDGFATSELEGSPMVITLLNHLVHQNNSTSLPVPEFVRTALRSSMNLTRAAQSQHFYGISIEPWNLRVGFGQSGLKKELSKLGGITTDAVRVAGDRVGKSVLGFSVPVSPSS